GARGGGRCQRGDADHERDERDSSPEHRRGTHPAFLPVLGRLGDASALELLDDVLGRDLFATLRVEDGGGLALRELAGFLFVGDGVSARFLVLLSARFLVGILLLARLPLLVGVLLLLVSLVARLLLVLLLLILRLVLLL